MNNQKIKFYMYYDLKVEKQNVDLRQERYIEKY